MEALQTLKINNGTKKLVLLGFRQCFMFTDGIGAKTSPSHARARPARVVQGGYQGLPWCQGHEHDDVLEERTSVLRGHPQIQTRSSVRILS